MNKKIISLVVLLVLLGGGGYYFKNRPTNPQTSQTLNQAMSEASQFAKAIESGKPTTCTMTKGNDTLEYLIKGKMMKADIKTMVDGKIMVSHMINDTKYFYSWSDSTTQGSKMAIPTEDEIKARADKEDPNARDYPSSPKFDSEADYDTFKNQGYVIDCKPASVDDSAFIPPSTINFIDPSEVMKNIPSSDANGKYDVSKLQELQKQYGGMTDGSN